MRPATGGVARRGQVLLLELVALLPLGLAQQGLQGATDYYFCGATSYNYDSTRGTAGLETAPAAAAADAGAEIAPPAARPPPPSPLLLLRGSPSIALNAYSSYADPGAAAYQVNAGHILELPVAVHMQQQQDQGPQQATLAAGNRATPVGSSNITIPVSTASGTPAVITAGVGRRLQLVYTPAVTEAAGGGPSPSQARVVEVLDGCEAAREVTCPGTPTRCSYMGHCEQAALDLAYWFGTASVLPQSPAVGLTPPSIHLMPGPTWGSMSPSSPPHAAATAATSASNNDSQQLSHPEATTRVVVGTVFTDPGELLVLTGPGQA